MKKVKPKEMTDKSDKRKEFEHLKKYYKPLLPNECQNCLETEDLVIHHIVPLIVGGTNHLTNLCVLCTECHSLIHRNTDENKISIKELTQTGIENKKKEKVIPKKEKDSEELAEAIELYLDGILTVKEITKLTGISRSALYEYLKKHKITRN